MGTIKQEAEQYTGQSTRNIAELPKVSTDLILTEKTGKGEDGEYKYNVIVVEGEEFRVPNIVLKNLQAILKENPNLKEFKVSKTGEGLKTTYTVIPLA